MNIWHVLTTKNSVIIDLILTGLIIAIFVDLRRRSKR